MKEKFVSSGITLLDLALTDTAGWGFPTGRIFNIIGDSSSGKTLLCLQVLAEANINKEFNEHLLVYNDVEAALSFDLGKLFGSLEKRIDLRSSDTIQEFYKDILTLLDSGKKFVYVLDSLDSLTSEEEEELATGLVKKGKMSGSYGLQKAKMMSQILRNINLKLKKTESMLFVISQTRDNLDAFSFQKKTRAGGKALTFYSTYEIWLARVKKVKKKGITIGVETAAKVTKNKITGKLREVKFPIYYEYGADDIGANIDFLIECGVWKKSGKNITTDFGKFTKSALIAYFEEDGKRIGELKSLVQMAWIEREKSIELHRRSKYEGTNV